MRRTEWNNGEPKCLLARIQRATRHFGRLMAARRSAGSTGEIRRCAVPKPRVEKANGAGIAADPTLTGVWMSLACNASGEPSALRTAGHAWRPMSSLCSASSCDRPERRFVTGARAGIRPSLGRALRLPSGRSRQVFAAAPSLVPRLPSLYRLQEPRSGGLRLSRCTSNRPGSWPVRCHHIAPGLEMVRLAFGRSLLQAVSRSARRQMSPPSLVQNFSNVRALRLVVSVVCVPKTS